MRTIVAAAVCLVCAAPGLCAPYSWQEPHARVLPTGELEWAPKPFRFEPGQSVRYIDYENGDDRNPGTKDRPWKHHPWDRAATGKAREGKADTYVFKRGVIYRGALVAEDSGRPGQPVRLTSDPGWSQGGAESEAVICGSERVTGWRKGSRHADIPEGEKVWVADVDFLPRRLWMIDAGGEVTRIALARTPNWKVSDPEEVLSEWWQWENPKWWVAKNRTTTVGGKKMHLGIDRKHLTRDPEYYEDAIVWSEWAIVMGTPFPTPVRKFFPDKKAIAFEGRWFGDSGSIHTGNRYFLENKPHYLDAPGEFWVEKRGKGGRIHLRLPDDRDPTGVTMEAAKRYNLIQDIASARSPKRLDIIGADGRAALDTTGLKHAVISGLTFRFSNAWWDYHLPAWGHKEVDNACIRLLGSSDDVSIRNCRFEHVSKAVRIEAINDKTPVGFVRVTDNDIRYTDDGAITITSGKGRLEDASVLRNNLYMVGMRPYRQSDGHALQVRFPATMEVAGNMLRRMYGAGIFLFGGKGGGSNADVPLARYLVHHNRAEQTLLATNDWGGIETWQGGPFYIYNNISGNPNGYWNWAYRPGRPGRLGFAYYLDGGFKNYLFNNIAWGISNDPTSKHCNNTAFYQAVAAILNSFFNNTTYKFRDGSGWSPAGGRQIYVGNLWLDISHQVFHHGKQKEDKDAVYDTYPHHTIAYADNVFHEIGESLGFLEGSGTGDTDLEGFRQAAKRRKLLASGVGVLAGEPVVRDAEKHDFRPVPDGAAAGRGARVFVPWGLARMVGEWNFRRNNADPAVALDEHWYMSPGVKDRSTYRSLPTYDLKGANITAESYTNGPLENWTPGALDLNGRDQYLTLANIASQAPSEPKASVPTRTVKPADWLSVEVPAAAVPGKPFQIRVHLADDAENLKMDAHLHWLKKQGWGGFMTLGMPRGQAVNGKGPYTFTFKPVKKPGLDAFSLLIGLSPSGQWKDNVKHCGLKIPLGKAPAAAPSGFPNPHDVAGNFLVEVCFKTAAGHTNGTLVCDMDERGYRIAIDAAGKAVFECVGDGKGQVTTDRPVNDGGWHHLIAEADRGNNVLRMHLDGKPAGEAAVELGGSLRNDAPLLVGKGPDGAFLAGSLEFLRICLGTLADARTSIEELHAWQFDGPFLKDFTGKPRDPKGSCAGALDARSRED